MRELEREYNVAVANGQIMRAARIARVIDARERDQTCPECEQPDCEGPEPWYAESDWRDREAEGSE